MCPPPEQLAAVLANKVLLDPTIGFGRDFIPESFFIYAFELAATIHATRFAQEEAELAEHQH